MNTKPKVKVGDVLQVYESDWRFGRHHDDYTPVRVVRVGRVYFTTERVERPDAWRPLDWRLDNWDAREYFRGSLYESKEAHQAFLEEIRLKNELCEKMRGCQWGRMEIDKLRRISAIINES